jgi:hypothetical protein
MEADESFTQMEEDQQRIRRLSDMETTTDGENNDGPEDEVTGSSDHEESSDEQSEAKSESLAGDNSDSDMEKSRKRAPKVSFSLNSIQVQILTVTFHETRRLRRS